MYAIILDGSRQLKVTDGEELNVDFRDLKAGEEVTFDKVLAVSGDSGVKIGQPVVPGASVTTQVVSVAQGPKLIVQKLRRRKTFRKKTGHRQLYTRVKVTAINAG
jgi:large subunit ribosomal protein L21